MIYYNVKGDLVMFAALMLLAANSPQTGDRFPRGLLLIIIVAAILLAVGTAVFDRKKGDDDDDDEE